MALSTYILYLLGIAFLGFLLGIAVTRIFAIKRQNAMQQDFSRRRARMEKRLEELETDNQTLQETVQTERASSQQAAAAAKDDFHQIEQLKLDVAVRNKHVDELESRLEAANRLLEIRRKQTPDADVMTAASDNMQSAQAHPGADTGAMSGGASEDMAIPTLNKRPPGSAAAANVQEQRYAFERDRIGSDEIDDDIAEITGAFAPFDESLQDEVMRSAAVPGSEASGRAEPEPAGAETPPASQSSADVKQQEQSGRGLFSAFNRRRDRD